MEQVHTVSSEVQLNYVNHYRANGTAQSAEDRDWLEPQRHIPTVNVLWHTMVAMCCFISPLALQLWSGRQGIKIRVSMCYCCI